MKFSSVFLLILLSATSMAWSQMRYCDLHGSVYEETDRARADFIVFEEESEAFADFLVFEEESRLYADRGGLWFFVEARGLADFSVYFTRNKGEANFIVHFTESSSFAGCDQ